MPTLLKRVSPALPRESDNVPALELFSFQAALREAVNRGLRKISRGTLLMQSFSNTMPERGARVAYDILESSFTFLSFCRSVSSSPVSAQCCGPREIHRSRRRHSRSAGLEQNHVEAEQGVTGWSQKGKSHAQAVKRREPEQHPLLLRRECCLTSKHAHRFGPPTLQSWHWPWKTAEFFYDCGTSVCHTGIKLSPVEGTLLILINLTLIVQRKYNYYVINYTFNILYHFLQFTRGISELSDL